MRIHRFYISDSHSGSLSQGERLVIQAGNDNGLVHQLFHVFRYTVGQIVILFDGSGRDFEAEIIEIDKKHLVFLITSEKEGLVQTKVLNAEVTLCFSLIKKDNIEYILQKCTELGVSQFYPLVSERSEKKEFNVERGQKILTEAIEQSGWSKIPVLHEPQSLEEVIQQTKNMKQVVFHTNLSGHPTPTLPLAGEGASASIALFIGPEGGWSDKEIELFKKHGFKFKSLGSSILRAETAAIAAVSRAQL